MTHRITAHETLILQTLRRIEERVAARLKAVHRLGSPAALSAAELSSELAEVQVCLEAAMDWPSSYDMRGEVIPHAMHRLPRRVA